MKPSSKGIKVSFDLEKLDEEQLCNLLCAKLAEASKDYTKKKKAKGEKVDYFKMQKALDQRKNIKILGKLLLAKTFARGNMLLKKESMAEASKVLLEDAEKLVNK